MPTYILCSSLTSLGGETLHANPDRMLQVNREIADFGCKLIGQYATLGVYDFVTIVEAPDNETIAHLSIDLGSRGTVRITTLPAMLVDDLVGKLKGPKQMGHAARKPRKPAKPGDGKPYLEEPTHTVVV
ncbi:MAG: GYD domain-containing protein [Sphingomonadales bacterium]